jgi:hypothetical protein
LIGAVLTVAWALRTRWKRGSWLGLIAGVVGIVAGLLVLGRHVLEPVVFARFLVDALGVSAVLTGTLRVSGAFEVERGPGDLVRVGGRVVEAVRGGGLLAAGLARKHWPAVRRVGQRLLGGPGGHGCGPADGMR